MYGQKETGMSICEGNEPGMTDDIQTTPFPGCRLNTCTQCLEQSNQKITSPASAEQSKPWEAIVTSFLRSAQVFLFSLPTWYELRLVALGITKTLICLLLTGSGEIIDEGLKVESTQNPKGFLLISQQIIDHKDGKTFYQRSKEITGKFDTQTQVK